jgi:broad specificity phosphatase PhoE
LFETLATSIDNEAGLASGSFDVALSRVGEDQAHALGVRRQHDDLAVVFCSDLQRAFRTATLRSVAESYVSCVTRAFANVTTAS